MFERIRAYFSGKSLIKTAYDNAIVMIDQVVEMYEQATALVLEGQELTINVKKEDKQINRMEVVIRRDILEHLTIDPGRELTASLILTVVVGYVERAGDYVKNIHELHGLHPYPLRDSVLGAELVELTCVIRENITLCRSAFLNENREEALTVIANHRKNRKVCDGIIERCYTLESLDRREALACAFYARYLKRISAGMKNIATTVTAPFDHIGYSKRVRKE